MPVRSLGSTKNQIALAAVVVGILVCGFATPASALVVTNTNDAGAGSLREAIANTVPAGTVTFDASVTGMITLSSGELTIDKTLTIEGPGARVLTVSGNNASRVFAISGPGVTATIRGLTITNGQTPDGAFENGGGISVGNGGALVLEDSAVLNSTAGPGTFGANGGGISGDGSGSITITRSLIAGNRALADLGSDASGGGIENSATGSAQFIVDNSTIANNSVVSATQADGGGIDAFGNLLIRNSTIAFNTIQAPSLTRGGGVFTSVDGAAERRIDESIIASNSIVGGAAGASNDCDTLGDVVDGDDNVVGDPAECGINGTNNVLGTASPGLNPLGNNGGPTNTVGLTDSSPALNHVAAANCPPPTTDQRGQPRPVGGACESGAWEGQLRLAIDPTSHNYGTLTVGQTSAPQRFTIFNPGDLSVPITSVATSNAQFAVVATTCTGTLGPGASCTVDVTFTATAAGAANATLTVTSSNAGAVTAALAGAGAQQPPPPPPPPPPPDDPCANDNTNPRVRIASDQRKTLYGLGQIASITTRASDASGLRRDPSRRGQRVSTKKTGSFTVRKTATDNCDNRGAGTFRYQVVGPMRASIVHEKAPPGCQPRIWARANVSSPVSLRGAQIFIDGKLKMTSTKSVFRAEILTRRLSRGKHTMTVAAVDSLGRRVRSTQTFRIGCS